MDQLQIVEADTRLREKIISLLIENNLPVADLDHSKRLFALLKEEDLVAAGGLEIHSGNALLRSVVVAKHQQGKGYGKTISRHLEQIAKTNGIESLFLLTTTAQQFFSAEGFVTVDRNSVPLSIKSTTEFSAMCPASAVVMKKVI